MNVKKNMLGLLLLAALLISACGVSGPTPEAVMEKEAPTAESMMAGEETKGEPAMDEDVPQGEETTMGEEMSTSEAMPGDEMSQDDTMMSEEMSEPDGMDMEKSEGDGKMDEDVSQDEEATMGEEMSTSAAMSDTPMSEDETMMSEEMSNDEAVAIPDWFSVELTDVNTGQVFQTADFEGKVVLVETLAVWCTTCLRQQKQVQALHELLGERDDLVSLGLDIDPNETADVLKAHTDKNGFDWHYAVAPAAVAREIGQLYGNQFLNPPSAPMFIIDRQGQVHLLPFGVKNAQTLQDALNSYLN